jgi:hypothetical protein
MHRYHICYGQDGDYIVLESRWWGGTHDMPEPVWVEHTRWLIPSTQIEEQDDRDCGYGCLIHCGECE